MDVETIWISIILPIFIGPFFLFIKLIYEKHMDRVNSIKLTKYNEIRDNIKQKLDLFYWPIYLRLLCIYQLNHLIPDLKKCCNNYSLTEINVHSYSSYNNQSGGGNYLDKYYNKNTDKLKLRQNEYCVECKAIIEKYIYICCPNDKLGAELINFLNHVNISIVIDEKREIEHNINTLLSLIETEVYSYQEEYNDLINNGPYNYNYKQI
jgi:hypothetical protein